MARQPGWQATRQSTTNEGFVNNETDPPPVVRVFIFLALKQ
jgi:hypothetical protein